MRLSHIFEVKILLLLLLCLQNLRSCAVLTAKKHPLTNMASSSGMVDPRIFEDLQTKIDEDAEVRDQIRVITQTLERQGRNAQSILSRAHSTPAAQRG